MTATDHVNLSSSAASFLLSLIKNGNLQGQAAPNHCKQDVHQFANSANNANALLIKYNNEHIYSFYY